MDSKKFSDEEMKMLKQINDHLRGHRRATLGQAKKINTKLSSMLNDDTLGLKILSDRDSEHGNMFMFVFKVNNLASSVLFNEKPEVLEKIKCALAESIRKLTDKVFLFQESMYVAIIPTRSINAKELENIAARLNAIVLKEFKKVSQNKNTVQKLDKTKIVIIELQKIVPAEKLIVQANQVLHKSTLEKTIVVKMDADGEDEQFVLQQSPGFTSEKFIALVAK